MHPSDQPLLHTAPGVLSLRGDWTLAQMAQLDALAGPMLAGGEVRALDGRGMTALDTAGALLLLRYLGADTRALFGDRLARDHARLLETVALHRGEPLPIPRKPSGFIEMLQRIGQATSHNVASLRALVGFLGQVIVALSTTLLHPARLRWTALVHHVEAVGLDAVPIVGLLSFLVGAVIAFLGATVLRDFGASVFTVELVSYAFLREFGVLLAAILIAGRSGSAFTAQIGSMKGREEIDAIRTLGLDPIGLLVVPRVLALVVALPLLTFLAMLLGIVGGGIVSWLALDIGAEMFVSRLYESTELRHFWVGMIKAPVFAFVIALVGCLEGLKVAGSAESVGRHTTSSVVQSIFFVILFDAIFAVFFMEIGL